MYMYLLQMFCTKQYVFLTNTLYVLVGKHRCIHDDLWPPVESFHSGYVIQSRIHYK